MKKPITQLILFITATLLFGCTNLPPSPPDTIEPDPTKPSYSLIGIYDSIDTAIVESIDTEEKTIVFINHALNKTYTLTYNDFTTILDKYDSALSMAQITTGEIVDVSFLKNEKILVTLQQSKTAFTFDNISRYTLNGERKMATIGDDNYRLNAGTLIASDGRRIDAADIINRDIVTIRGVDRDIWSIVVQRGHGYLKLKNDIYAIGGWIEIGQTIIQKITDNMLMTVPEGTFDIHISASGFSTTRKVTIERNKETIIDLGDVEVETPRTGKVLFTVSPASATVYIDGKEVDIRGVVELEFGLYQVICEAPGYDTVTLHIKVSQDIASVSITMDVEGTNTGNDSGSVSGNTLPIEIGRNRVYIDAPSDVEVYQDGVYVGISPVYFDKVPGSHTITLRKLDYITKSYQIHLDNEATDVTYSFSALERNSLDSGNSVSGNN